MANIVLSLLLLAVVVVVVEKRTVIIRVNFEGDCVTPERG